MKHRARRMAGALLLVALAALMVESTTAQPAEAGERHATQRFLIGAHDTSGIGRLVASGPINGVGTDTLLTHVQNADGTFTDTDRFNLASGQVFLRDTYVAAVISDPTSCVTDISVSGRYVITGGNGGYAGAAGAGTFTATGTAVSRRGANGACLSLDDPPIAFAEIVRGVGTTSLP